MTQRSPFFETPPGEEHLPAAAELLAHSHIQHGHALNEIDRLRAINAELLTSLERLLLNYVAALSASGAKIEQKSVVKARAAIRKAKGE